MNSEGLTLVARALLVGFLILAGATVRTLVGPSKKRGGIMMAGGLAGIAFGVLIAYPISRWLKTDVSAITATLGMPLGWAASWPFAKQVPRESN
jgi:hypothetical protein